MRQIRLIIIFICTVFLLFTVTAAVIGQEEPEPVPDSIKAGFESITSSDAMNYVTFLSADELEGRNTPSMGLKIARNYIKSLYKLWGIAPAGDVGRGKRSFEQEIPLVIMEPGELNHIVVSTEATTNRFKQNIDFRPTRGGNKPIVLSAPVTFVGYGIHAPDLGYDDFAGVDLNGKIALVFRGMPGANREDSPFARPEVRARFAYNRPDRGLTEEYSKRGAAAVLVVTPAAFKPERKYKRGGYISAPHRDLMVPSLPPTPFDAIPTYVVSSGVADAFLAPENTNCTELKEKIDTSLKPHSKILSGAKITINISAKQTPVHTANLIGMIEGSDPQLKDEVVLVCAHLDHLGITEDGYVFNGADDNASGCAAVLEVAQAFALNPVKPKRTIMFIHWTGEENGAIGSRYFIHSPTIPLEKILVCINLDMVGREWTQEYVERALRWFAMPEDKMPKTEEEIKRLVTLQQTKESPALEKIIEEQNKKHIGLFCWSRYCSMMGGSDEFFFYLKKIPAVYFSPSTHDEYHTPDDTVDLISGDKIQQIARLSYLTAFEIANRPERLAWVE